MDTFFGHLTDYVGEHAGERMGHLGAEALEFFQVWQRCAHELGCLSLALIYKRSLVVVPLLVVFCGVLVWCLHLVVVRAIWAVYQVVTTGMRSVVDLYKASTELVLQLIRLAADRYDGGYIRLALVLGVASYYLGIVVNFLWYTTVAWAMLLLSLVVIAAYAAVKQPARFWWAVAYASASAKELRPWFWRLFGLLHELLRASRQYDSGPLRRKSSVASVSRQHESPESFSSPKPFDPVAFDARLLLERERENQVT